MKKLVLLLSVFLLLIFATGAVSASDPAPGTFTITGYTTDYSFRTGPNGRTWFHLTARGGGDDSTYDQICQAYSGGAVTTCAGFCELPAGKACGVEGYFDGEFTFEEWGVVDLDPVTGTGSGKGTNTGIVTITTADGQERVRFVGVTDSVSVGGKFTLEPGEGTRCYAGLQGSGNYRGNAGLAFTVTFTGRFEH